MSALTHAKLALATVGLMIWGYGVKTEDPIPTWLGIAMLVAGAALRFYKPRSPNA